MTLIYKNKLIYNELIHKTEKDSDIQNKLMVTEGEREEDR